MQSKTLPHLDTISTVTEKEANSEVTTIFADIKETLGVPFVNLIWRHLATIPGGLAMTWSLAKPLYASKILNESARALRRETALVQTLSPWILQCAGRKPNFLIGGVAPGRGFRLIQARVDQQVLRCTGTRSDRH